MSSFSMTLQDEKLKIQDLSDRKEKAGYIWDYYKLWIIGIAAFLIILITGAYHFFFTTDETWFYITFANTYADIGDDSTLWKGYTDYTGLDLKEKNIEFDAASYFDYAGSVTGNSYFEAFVARTEAGTLDAVTMEEDSLIGLGESGRLLDLNSEEAASLKEKYGDRFVYCEPYDTSYSTDPVPVGIDISDSILMTEYNIYNDSCVLGVGANTKNIAQVESFLDYIFAEED